MSASLRRARASFELALHELSDEPTGATIVRYLVASRNLEQAKEDVRRRQRAFDRSAARRLRLSEEGAA